MVSDQHGIEDEVILLILTFTCIYIFQMDLCDFFFQTAS